MPRTPQSVDTYNALKHVMQSIVWAVGIMKCSLKLLKDAEQEFVSQASEE
jgi:hypothetical protein